MIAALWVEEFTSDKAPTASSRLQQLEQLASLPDPLDRERCYAAIAIAFTERVNDQVDISDQAKLVSSCKSLKDLEKLQMAVEHRIAALNTKRQADGKRPVPPCPKIAHIPVTSLNAVRKSYWSVQNRAPDLVTEKFVESRVAMHALTFLAVAPALKFDRPISTRVAMVCSVVGLVAAGIALVCLHTRTHTRAL